MKIKFLSIIASVFMVSFLITSCLDSENNVEYSPDATIRAFELDTVGYGKSYKFTIDQINGLIYNEDSLPVHADTIIDRILIKTLTTASGLIIIKGKSGQDSLLNINDSIDLRKYINPSSKDKHLEMKVLAPDASSSRIYHLGVRIHKHDPDSLTWKYNISILPKDVAQKSILLNDQIITYVVVDNALKAFLTSTINPKNCTSATVTGGTFNDQLPTSIVIYKNVLYATSASKDGKVYQSTDGITWAENANALFGIDHVDMLLTPLNDKITYIIKVTVNERYFSSTAKISARANVLQKVPENFPSKNFSHITYYQGVSEKPASMLIGEYTDGQQPTVGSGDTKVKVIEPWGYEGDKWVSLPPNNVEASCPALKNPTLMYYNNRFYIFGNEFKTFYASYDGMAWKKANAKFSFPHYTDWAKRPPYSPKDTPEFRGRENYSAVVDAKTAKIWVLFSGGKATFEEIVKKATVRAEEEVPYTYDYDSEVWSGRLNQLWFDIANGKYTY